MDKAAVVALSLPELILLRRVLRPQPPATFVGVVATGILATGHLFNAILSHAREHHMEIKVLGSGCANRHTLERLTREALADLDLAADISAVADYPTILGYGVMSTLALVIDERVVLAGRVPTKAQVTELITAARTATG